MKGCEGKGNVVGQDSRQSILQHVRFQEAAGLAEGTRTNSQRPPRRSVYPGAQYAALRNQMVRAAMSVSANIVEGREQRTEREFARFLGYALGSISELEHHLIVARDLRTITDIDFSSTLAQLIDVRKMLHGLLAKLSQMTTSASKRPVSSSLADSVERSAGSGQQRS